MLILYDQGTQYGSDDWQRFCRDHNLEPNMSRRGNCWDNAVVESFLSNLKKKRIKKRVYKTRGLARADVFDYIKERWLLGEFTVAGTELASQFNLERNKTSRCLRALVRKGLIEEAGTLEVGPEGGRPSALYRPAGGSSLEGWQTSQTCQTSRASYEKRGLPPLTPLTRSDGGSSSEGGLAPLPGTPVELHRNGAWSNGWVVLDATNANSVKAAKLGNSNITVGNLRWDVDVRLCQSSPFKADSAEPTDLFDF